MDVEYWPIENIRPYLGNAKQHNVEWIAESIRQFKPDQPIVVDKDGVIIKGHGRLKAAKALDMKEFPVVVRDDLTPEQVRIARIADNRSAEAGWDGDMLVADLEGVELDADMAALGISDDWLSEFRIDEPADGLTDPDDVPDTPEEPISKTGDLWLLGDHRLLCGDCTKKEDVERVMAGERAALIATDPPYNIQTLSGFGSRGNRSYAGLESAPTYGEWMGHAADVSRENAGAFVWEDWRNVVPLWQALESEVGPVKDFVVWHVTNRRARQFRKGFYPEWDMCLFAAKNGDFEWHFSGEGSRANVYTSAAVTDNSGVYGKKPVELISRFVGVSTGGDDVVYEPFSGSGTTIIAAEQLGRKCYAIEIEPRYVDVAVRRWEEFTGRKARTEDGKTLD